MNKPNENIEVPPFQVLTEGFGCSNHKFEWKISSMGNYKQEVCKKCGVTGETKKNDMNKNNHT